MSTTTMHFGPEWMRPKHQPSKPSPPSPPPTTGAQTTNASTYSALVTPVQTAAPERHDEAHPFRYSKEEMLRIYKEGGGKGGLGLEVERWEGVVRDVETEPIGLREMGEAEKKLFTSPLNSDLRRRQSNDYLHLNTQNLERPRLNHASSGSATGSPLRERYGNIMARRRDSTDQAPTLAPRKLSLTGQAPLLSPRDTALPSPRGRVGFDGVLNGGDSWTARRKASESLVKTPGVSRDNGAEDSRNSDIREEDEENGGSLAAKVDTQTHPDPVNTSNPNGSATQQFGSIEKGMAQLSVEPNGAQSLSNSFNNSVPMGPPPGITDLASVEWSYLDPQGQVQGPFRADLMQKWHDDGYFTPDLYMKRTSLDSDWTSVGDLVRRAGGGKVFLTPPAPSLPPGLLRRTDSPLNQYGLSNDQAGFNAPFQPAPIRSLRSATLDTYFGSGSNPSDSPASSFGARFSNGSPDPAAFGGRADQYASGDIGGFPVNDSPARRSTFADAFVDTRFGNAFNANGAYASNASPWPPSNVGAGFDNMNTGRNSTDFQAGYGGQFGSGSAASNSAYVDTLGNNAYRDYAGFSSTGGQHNVSQAFNNRNGGGIPFADSNQQQYSSPFIAQQQFSAIPETVDQQDPRLGQGAPVNVPGTVMSSPWRAVDAPVPKSAGPFDTAQSNSSIANHSPIPSQSSPWGSTTQLYKQTAPVSDAILSQASTDISKEESEISIPSVDQLPGSIAEESLAPEPQSESFSLEATASPESAPESSPTVVPVSTPAPTTKARAKPVQPIVPTQTSPEAPTAQIATSPSPSQPVSSAPSKAAWAKDDESKKTAMSLREIQDAEAKKAEARKAAEREKERVVRAAATAASTEDVQPFTTSWGLPTSKAGKVAAVAPQPKDAVLVATPPPTTPPVWTQAGKPAATKKTMKEIQEEEERRKKMAVKESVVGVAPRRGYAESTTKATPPATQNNAWTTVGPSGKAVLASSPVRPQPTPSATTTSAASVPRTNGTTASRPATSSASATKAAPSNNKVDDFPIAPSHEFLRWLNDNLKGLNNSVNFEEILSMLLSFPLDPDASTVEIISDLIYANSTTLDGRRFASEFVTRRKADATARSKAGAGAGAGKPISIAEVVKAQPKPQAQPEWGGFKVVNKKKKGGRS
ncbi:hypothetical protein D9758_000086 [Tetrapyrgos nigripes]|uniref:GYF domain-containing protein n=1 Tax=Tetrapyrgos nigripes TaxID=182062 RepID=A0A8H5H1Z6_9AGAR|nr:hypothetical protein D9758_000086 [Tetrapyrgos nigripes]